MICEVCHKTEATVFVHKIVDGVSQSKKLCTECHEASSPEARDFAAAQQDARCEYCGGQPCSTGTDISALVTGVQKLKFMCLPCSMEHSRFNLKHLSQDASRLSQHEQLELIRKIDDEADTHMKQWVLHRGSR